MVYTILKWEGCYVKGKGKLQALNEISYKKYVGEDLLNFIGHQYFFMAVFILSAKIRLCYFIIIYSFLFYDFLSDGGIISIMVIPFV